LSLAKGTKDCYAEAVTPYGLNHPKYTKPKKDEIRETYILMNNEWMERALKNWHDMIRLRKNIDFDDCGSLDLHLFVAFDKVLHEIAHTFTEEILEYEREIRAQKNESLATKRIIMTPNKVGTKKSFEEGIDLMGDMGYGLQERLFGHNLRLKLGCTGTWIAKSIYFERSILEDTTTSEIKEVLNTPRKASVGKPTATTTSSSKEIADNFEVPTATTTTTSSSSTLLLSGKKRKPNHEIGESVLAKEASTSKRGRTTAEEENLKAAETFNSKQVQKGEDADHSHESKETLAQKSLLENIEEPIISESIKVKISTWSFTDKVYCDEYVKNIKKAFRNYRQNSRSSHALTLYDCLKVDVKWLEEDFSSQEFLEGLVSPQEYDNRKSSESGCLRLNEKVVFESFNNLEGQVDMEDLGSFLPPGMKRIT
jgi:hypothetical protein